MQLSEQLKRTLAQGIYEQVRQQLAFNPIKSWDELSEDEQKQCMDAIYLWLAGLGSNEVGEAWYERSGHFPPAIWNQLPDTEHVTIFKLAGVDVIIRLIALAEAGLQAQKKNE